MTTITEADVERAALDWLEGLGWRMERAPETPNAERDDYGQVVLEGRLRDALADLNWPTFPISDCGCPKNPPSFTTVMVGASTNAVNCPIGLTNPSLGAVN